ncbi:MAG TPA: protein-L-isoaspartate(D-aspartate) O-methyltransferase [Candidatus Aquilonibacter sp.]|nr:protein-L-isoaspartate(D-aspartate) O-methyltransferase [Candidatus Aquilonibacter sp.]
MADAIASRQRMVQSQLRDRGISDPRVLAAMSRVPRDQFVSEPFRAQAYDDHPLPIGEGQTISQPYIVAVMLESLQLTPREKVLEIGAGSGYATALLAELAGQVFSMERHPALAENARQTLAALGYTNVKIFTGDGSLGIPSAAPFDAILVSAAAPEVPAPLLSQLADGGRMMIPVGSGDSQQLQFIRMINGQPIFSARELVRFVPLVQDGAD